MYIYSDDKSMIIGCYENNIKIIFTLPIPAWAIVDDI